jgi:hypothetical protein
VNFGQGFLEELIQAVRLDFADIEKIKRVRVQFDVRKENIIVVHEHNRASTQQNLGPPSPLPRASVDLPIDSANCKF